MPKRKPNQEIFEDGDRSITLAADFGFLEALNACGKDCAEIFSELAAGLMNPTDIKNIVVCSLVDIDGEPVKDSEREAITVDIINRYGLQEVSCLARIMLSHGLIGDIKKHQGAEMARQRMITEQFLVSKSTDSKKVFALWAAMLIASIAFQCMIFKLWSPLGG